MGRKTAADKLELKRAAWLERTKTVLGADDDETLALLRLGRQQSVRLNPLVADPLQTVATMRELGWQGQAFEWAENCYTIDAGLEALRDSQLASDGALLIQNAASWLPVIALDPQPGDAILDVCAAPGGKTTHIAALAHNQAQIIANDNSRARLIKLQAMTRRMSADIERYTLYDALHLSRKLEGEQFDRILIDAPCSGEGMMQFDRNKDFESWSVAHIKRLQQLQKRVLMQAWQLLKPGGTLVYSTCTMAPEEDEAVIDYALRALGDASIVELDWQLPNRVAPVLSWSGKAYNPELTASIRLKPSQYIEAFFVCKLVKSA
jgi:NOL1/NOP2/sun family putative RNA methylase